MDKIVAEVTPETATFENVVLPMARDENIAALQTHLIGVCTINNGQSLA